MVSVAQNETRESSITYSTRPMMAGFLLEIVMPLRLGAIPIEVSLSANRLITGVYEIVCLCRFSGSDNLGVGKRSTTRSAGNKTVIGKITLAGDPIGHPKIITTALCAAWDNMKPFEQDSIFHVDNLSTSVA